MDFLYRRRVGLLALMSALVALAACSGDGASSTTASSIPVATIVPSDDGVDANVPDDYLDQVLADVATRTGLPHEDLTVLDATLVEWADQRLGCVHLPEPAEPMPIDGYRVVVDTGQAEFDYRLDEAGTSYLCGDPVGTSEEEADEGGHHEDDEAPENATS